MCPGLALKSNGTEEPVSIAKPSDTPNQGGCIQIVVGNDWW